MIKRARIFLVVAFIIASLLLSYTFLKPKLTSSKATSSQVLTWDCESPESKPESIMITCGDGGMYVDRITWNTWSSNGAQGTGFYNVNDCDPNCAAGNMHESPVNIKLSGLANVRGKNYLRTKEIQTLDGKNLPETSQSHYTWDVMEFEEMMNK